MAQLCYSPFLPHVTIEITFLTLNYTDSQLVLLSCVVLCRLEVIYCTAQPPAACVISLIIHGMEHYFLIEWYTVCPYGDNIQ